MKRFFPQFSTSSFRLSTIGKMKCSMSRLSLRSPLALVLISFVVAATLITLAVSANRKANSGKGVSPVNPAQDARATKPLTRMARRNSLTPMAPMPFLPTITATLDDNFSLASKKNPGDTINYTAVITNTAGTDATGVAYTDTLDINTTLSGVVRVSPVTVNDSYTATGNVSINVPVGSGVLGNDYLGQNPAVSTVFASDTTSTQGGTVTVNADGSFTYNPPANFTGSDTFTYTLQNVTGSSVGTVTINVSDRILFVGGAGNCKPATPCTFATADALLAPTGKDLVFVASSGSPYSSAAISLNSGQTIAGQAISITTALSDAGITLAPFSQSLSFPASTTPVLNNAGTIITLGGNNLVEDLSINPSGGTGGIVGNNITTSATIRDLTITATNAANGVSLTGTNTGSTFTFSNIGITSASGTSLLCTGGGTIVAVQNNTTTVNTLNSTAGTGLQISNTTISASGVTFRSISSNGATNGIVLNNTGSSGGLTISGNGGTCTSAGTCTGGAIQNAGVGISLTTTQSVSIDRLLIQTTTHSGVNGTSVTNFSFTNGKIDSAGGATFESAIGFNGVSTGVGNNIAGTLTITGNTLTNSFYSGVDVQSDNGTVTNANISNNTITNTNQGLGINFNGSNNASTAFNLQNATINQNNISGIGDTGIQAQCSSSNAAGPGASCGTPGDGTKLISITNNSVLLQSTGTQGITITSTGGNSGSRAKGNFLVQCNGRNTGGCTAPTGTALGSSSQGTVILIGNNGFADMTAVINNNSVVATHTPNLGGGNGIAGGNGVAGAGNAWTPQLTLTVTNNSVSGTDGNGILLVGRGATSFANMKITGNTVGTPVNAGGTSRESIRVDAGNAASADDGVCVTIATNTCSVGSNGAAGIGIRKQGTVQGTNDFGITGLVPSPATGAQAATFVAAQNPAGNGCDNISGSNFQSCASAPPIAPPDGGGIAANVSPRTIGNGDSFEQTQLSNTTLTNGGSASPTTFAWLRQVLNPVAAFASTLNFLSNSDATTERGLSPRVSKGSESVIETGGGRASGPSAANTIAPTSKPVMPFSGETVSFSLPVVLNVGKSVTIKYDATVNTPPGAASVQTQGTVTGSNFTLVNGINTTPNTKDPETGTVVPTKTNINVDITWIGVTSTDWDTATNWDFNYVPLSFSDVKVPNAAQPNQPTLSTTSPTINSLNLGNTRVLTISGQTLTITGSTGSDLTLDGNINGGALNFGAGTHAINNASLTGSITPTNTTTVLSGANVTLNNNLQMDSLTINSGGTLNITNKTLSLTGSLNNGGTFTLTGSTVIFDGTGAQTLTNTTAFNNLTSNNTGGSVTLGSNITVNGILTLTSDLTTTNSFTLTMPTSTGTISGGADVVGNITRTNGAGMPTLTNIAFGNPNTVLNFTAAGTRPTSINFRLTKTVPTDAATGGTNTGFPGAVKRTWIITPTGGSGFSATMQLHYLVGDLNGNSEANPGPGPTVSLRLYKFVVASPSTGWQQQDLSNNFANTTIDTSSPGNHFVKLVGVTGFSPWTIGGVSPTAATSTVSGRITDDAGNPVEGAVIRLSGTQDRKTITDSQGNYHFDEVETNGFYTVTPSRVNYNFAPATRGFSALGAHTEASFGAAANGNHLNPLDTTEYFVRQQYVDFLGREPEEKGFNDWTDTINNCASGDASCDRVHVSEAFFKSEEFQQRGYFVYRFYSVAFGQKPDYTAFAPDLRRVSGFLDATQLEAAKMQFASDFTSRAAFVNQYGMLTNSQYVDALSQTAGVTLSNRQALVDSLEAGTLTRAQALRQIAESGEVYAKYYNQAFVVMEYFGYLRRDPDSLYLNWISVLDANPADSRRMVEGFVDATEYRNRFKQ